MGTEKRQRQKELSRSRAEQARKEAEKAQQKRRTRSAIIFGVVTALIFGLIAWTLSGDDDDTEVASDITTTTEAPASTEPAATGETPTTIAPNIAPADAGCPATDGSAPHYTGFEAPHEMCIDPAKTYTAEIQTNLGSFTITLDAQKAPKTVNNFVTLARYHYYDGLAFHRIIPGFMFQGGDPQGTGMGGPGYQFDDELPEQGEYELYSVAMANAGPNTNGSQFFVITGDSGIALPPNYSLFGKVTAGTEVAEEIGRVATDSKDLPLEAVVMEKVTITES